MALEAAVEVLAGRATVPVTVDSSIRQRLPAAIEAAAYYVVAEALTNVARYARASEATIRLDHQDECLFVEVTDNGVGGADPQAGSGLRGLTDRIDALDGSLTISSQPGLGTDIHVKLPLPIPGHGRAR